MFKPHLNATAGVLAGLLLFFSTNLHAQDKTPCDYSIPGEVINWNFGDKAQLTFSEETLYPVSTAMPGGIDIPKGVSSISDTEGNLLFFSNGMRLWSSGFFEIINGTDLYGSLGATQSAIFIPAPNNVNKYFIFTADFYYPDIPQYNNHGIRYSVIEKTNYQWEVTDEKNQLILSENAQKLTAVKHANGQDYWLLTHGFGVNNGGKYFAYLITENGIDPNNVVTSNVGYFHDGTSSDNNNAGYMKISIDGKKIALVIPSENGVIEVADFNSATGEVSNAINNEGTFFNMPLGLEFSPNSKLLYVSTNPKPQSQGDKNSYILQFNLDQLDFSNYHILEELSINDNGRFGALQLGPDGRIYAARGGVSLSPFEKLGIIYNPNRFGTACNYNHIDGVPSDGLELADETGSIEGLPNFVSSYFDIPSFWWQNHCATHITTFRLQNEANNGNVSWDFGINGATDNDLRGEYTYEEAGTYTVTVTEDLDGETYTHTRDITIYPLPSIDIGAGEDVIYILPNSAITLDAGEFDYYYWENEDEEFLGADRYYEVDKEGIYAVTVTAANCCENRDEVEIKFANIYLPNAFKPGSDIIANKTFKALGAVSALNNFNLIIYNRWGQLVFESNDPLNGWDGTIKGSEAPAASYVWQMSYESLESQYQAAQKIVERGVVTLVR